MSSLSQSLQNIPYPTPQAYNPNNFQGAQANYAGANAQTAQQGADANRMPGGGNVNPGMASGQADIYAQGAMEPYNANAKQNLWDIQNQVAQNSFTGQNAANNEMTGLVGNLLGTGIGAGGSALYNALQTPVTGANSATSPQFWNGANAAGPLANSYPNYALQVQK